MCGVQSSAFLNLIAKLLLKCTMAQLHCIFIHVSYGFGASLNPYWCLFISTAKVANCGGFQKLENLSLSVNHSVTETGWRNFFKTLNNMPALKKLDISRLFTHQIKASAPTVTAFVQCVSRLPGLVTIQMLGWLLDAEDLQMFDIMKEQHPQSRSLKLSWQWILPVSPIFQD